MAAEQRGEKLQLSVIKETLQVGLRLDLQDSRRMTVIRGWVSEYKQSQNAMLDLVKNYELNGFRLSRHFSGSGGL